MFARTALRTPSFVSSITKPKSALLKSHAFSSTARMTSFDRLIRFQTASGETKYGNLPNELSTREIEGSEVEVLDGDVKSGFKKAGSKDKVGKLLCPLRREEMGVILCVGLNYRRHAEECDVSL